MRTREEEYTEVLEDFEKTGNHASLQRLIEGVKRRIIKSIELHVHHQKLISKINFGLFKVRAFRLSNLKAIEKALRRVMDHKGALKASLKTSGNVPPRITSIARAY